MLKELLEKILEIQQPKVVPVYESRRKKTILLENHVDPVDYEKDPAPRAHEFNSLEGFIDYLGSDTNKTRNTNPHGVVFVSQDKVRCDLDYGIPGSADVVTLPLGYSAEFKALTSICYGYGSAISQKGLWRLLVSDLADCMPEDLLLNISQIRMANNADANCEITAGGLKNAEMKNAVTLHFKGGETEIRTNWQWVGRLYEVARPCPVVEKDVLVQQIPIDLRLELNVDEDNQLRFTFHPKRLDLAQLDARMQIVDYLKTRVPSNYSVHEGKL